jgi:hypothetical protein
MFIYRALVLDYIQVTSDYSIHTIFYFYIPMYHILMDAESILSDPHSALG